jgi:hypothetical protein
MGNLGVPQMRKATILLVAVLTSLWAGRVATAAETTFLRAGDATGPSAVFVFDKEAKGRAIIVHTRQAGVAGARFEISIDGATKPVFDHIFTTGECKFSDDGSRCDVTIPQSSPEFAAILRGFRRGRMVRVSIQDAGVMRMDQTVSLAGVAKAVRGL